MALAFPTRPAAVGAAWLTGALRTAGVLHTAHVTAVAVRSLDAKGAMSQLARLAIAHGDSVVISNSRGPETLAALVKELGLNARAGTVLGSVLFGSVGVGEATGTGGGVPTPRISISAP